MLFLFGFIKYKYFMNFLFCSFFVITYCRSVSDCVKMDFVDLVKLLTKQQHRKSKKN